MRASSLLVCLLFAGCHDSVTAPTKVSAASVEAVPAQCVPFDVEWQVDVDASGPIVTFAPKGRIVSAYEVQEASGAPWQEFGGWTAGTYASVTFDAHFNARYRIKGKVGDCWSNWHEFTTGPANPNASGDYTRPTAVPPLHSAYYATRCVQATSIVAGISEVLTFNAPMGSYRVTATTWDKFHKAGYQVGQVETAIVSGFGVTEDIGDLETSHATSWTTRLPISEIRVTGNQGSLHGDNGAVCVTVEE